MWIIWTLLGIYLFVWAAMSVITSIVCHVLSHDGIAKNCIWTVGMSSLWPYFFAVSLLKRSRK